MTAVQYDGPITIAVGQSRRSTQWQNRDLMWSQLVNRLEIPERTQESAKEYTDLQTKYNDETAKYQKQIADRDYADALETAFNDGKIEFTSKGAKAAACADFMATRCELKDGKLVGFDDRIKAMREKDPDSFRAEKPDPSFANPTGNGGPVTLSRAAQAARAAAAKFGPVSTPAENTNTK